MKWLKHFLVWPVLGYLLAFYSEFLFYGQRSDPTLPEPPLTDLISLWIAYTAMAYLLLSIIRYFRVQSLPALFVAGAAYGWMLEGMVVATLYQSLPLTISFTALAWHAPIDVVLSLSWMPRLLQEASPWKTAGAMLGMGVVWGIWVLWPWHEIGNGIDPGAFLGFGLLSTAALLPAYWLLGRQQLAHFQPRRTPLLILSSLLVVFYLFNSLITYGAAALILPLLLLLCWWGLARSRRREIPGDLLPALSGKPRLVNLALLMLLPLSAYTTYRIFLENGWILPSNVLLGLTASVGGAALFLISLGKLLSGPSASPTTKRTA